MELTAAISVLYLVIGVGLVALYQLWASIEFNFDDPIDCAMAAIVTILWPIFFGVISLLVFVGKGIGRIVELLNGQLASGADSDE